MPRILSASIDALRDVVHERRPVRFVWPPDDLRITVDVFTACAMITCYDAATADNQDRICEIVRRSARDFSLLADIARRKVTITVTMPAPAGAALQRAQP